MQVNLPPNFNPTRINESGRPLKQGSVDCEPNYVRFKPSGDSLLSRAIIEQQGSLGPCYTREGLSNALMTLLTTLQVSPDMHARLLADTMAGNYESIELQLQQRLANLLDQYQAIEKGIVQDEQKKQALTTVAEAATTVTNTANAPFEAEAAAVKLSTCQYPLGNSDEPFPGSEQQCAVCQQNAEVEERRLTELLRNGNATMQDAESAAAATDLWKQKCAKVLPEIAQLANQCALTSFVGDLRQCDECLANVLDESSRLKQVAQHTKTPETIKAWEDFTRDVDAWHEKCNSMRVVSPAPIPPPAAIPPLSPAAAIPPLSPAVTITFMGRTMHLVPNDSVSNVLRSVDATVVMDDLVFSVDGLAALPIAALDLAHLSGKTIAIAVDPVKQAARIAEAAVQKCNDITEQLACKLPNCEWIQDRCETFEQRCKRNNRQDDKIIDPIMWDEIDGQYLIELNGMCYDIRSLLEWFQTGYGINPSTRTAFSAEEMDTIRAAALKAGLEMPAQPPAIPPPAIPSQPPAIPPPAIPSQPPAIPSQPLKLPPAIPQPVRDVCFTATTQAECQEPSSLLFGCKWVDVDLATKDDIVRAFNKAGLPIDETMSDVDQYRQLFVQTFGAQTKCVTINDVQDVAQMAPDKLSAADMAEFVRLPDEAPVGMQDFEKVPETKMSWLQRKKLEWADKIAQKKRQQDIYNKERAEIKAREDFEKQFKGEVEKEKPFVWDFKPGAKEAAEKPFAWDFKPNRAVGDYFAGTARPGTGKLFDFALAAPGAAYKARDVVTVLERKKLEELIKILGDLLALISAGDASKIVQQTRRTILNQLDRMCLKRGWALFDEVAMTCSPESEQPAPAALPPRPPAALPARPALPPLRPAFSPQLPPAWGNERPFAF